MARIFITGSSDGIGHNVAKALIAQGHSVTLHARGAARAKETLSKTPGASNILIADLSSISQTKHLASEANKLEVFDAVVHNAGLGYSDEFKKSEDGIAQIFAVNALAPYILTALMNKPKRLIFVSSSLHKGGDDSMDAVGWNKREWDGFQAYNDSKLMDLILALAVAKRWPDVSSNAVDPGWLPTKMGGSGASQSMEKATAMISWLATGDPKEIGSGKYYVAQKGASSGSHHPSAQKDTVQEKFLRVCQDISGVRFPSKAEGSSL